MPQHAFTVELAPGTGAEYARLHEDVPPAVLDQIRRAGITNYSIFLASDRIFGVFDYQDAAQVRQGLEGDLAPEWTAALVAIMLDREIDPQLGSIAGLPRVFRLDS